MGWIKRLNDWAERTLQEDRDRQRQADFIQTEMECERCGRLSSIERSVAARNRFLGQYGIDTDNWWRMLARKPDDPLRPALLQRDLGWTYEDATAFLTAAAARHLLSPKGRGYMVHARICEVCITEPPRPRPTRDPIPPQLRFRVLQRDNFRCAYCGKGRADGAVLHVDHVVPVMAGGETTEDNLITACEECNLGKSARSVL
jgi:5-methylcytosine-specific restriction endonuclease McrA